MIEYRDNHPLEPVEGARLFDASGISRPTEDIPRVRECSRTLTPGLALLGDNVEAGAVDDGRPYSQSDLRETPRRPVTLRLKL